MIRTLPGLLLRWLLNALDRPIWLAIFALIVIYLDLLVTR